MKSRQEHKRDYRERTQSAGVFQIKNTITGKVFLGSTVNLESWANRHRFMLTLNGHPNAALQQDWNTYGSDAFLFEILEEVNVDDSPNFKLNDELTLLEQIWIEEFQPFEERCYNRDQKIRQV